MAERDVVVVNGGGKLAYFIAGLLIAAGVVCAVLYAQGYFDRSQSTELKLEIPKVDLPAN